MRNKSDFEILVYKKADALAAKEYKHINYRKSAVSVAAAFIVLTAIALGSVFAFNGLNLSDKIDMYAKKNMMNNLFNNNSVGTEVNCSDDYYKEEDSENYSYSCEEQTSEYHEEEKDQTGKSNELEPDFSGANGRVIYEKNGKEIVIKDENISNEFNQAVTDLVYLDSVYSEKDEIPVCTLDIVNVNSDLGKETQINLSICKEHIYIKYCEYRYDSDSKYICDDSDEKINFSKNDDLRVCAMSDDLTELIREYFDKDFTLK